MKKKFFILVLAACSLLSCQNGLWDAIHDLEDKYADLDSRVTKLEELCKEMNTNISALQTLVSVILTNDYIISITPITKDGKDIGYTITFAIHEPITIYHGQNGKDGADGKDGQNGKDGKDGEDGRDGLNGEDGHDGQDGLNGEDGKDGADGITPIIGVALDETDNAYYWTLNGEWLLDANGNRIPLSSRDGVNGQDGEDGQDGQDGRDGADGQDGITPRLKIENDYWYISYDNGYTWTMLGKATGEDGKDGQDGEKGEKGDQGDTMFESITQDDYYMYVTLSNGTMIKIPIGSEDYGTDPENYIEIVDGVIIAGFSVSATQQVYFTNGNLQYQPSTNNWRFAKRQYDWMGLSNSNITSTFTGWIDNFISSDTTGCPYMDNYRILSKDEWAYLFNRSSGGYCGYALACVNSVYGIIILPDIFIQPRGITLLQKAPVSGSNQTINHHYTENIINANNWREYERAGAVFLPMTKTHSNADVIGIVSYWCSNMTNILSCAIEESPYTQYMPRTVNTSGAPNSIRLVKDVE